MADQQSSDPWSAAGEGETPADWLGSAADETGAAGPGASAPVTDPWGAGTGTGSSGGDFLSQATEVERNAFDLLQPFQDTMIPLDRWVQDGVDGIAALRPVFQVIRWPVDQTLTGIENVLMAAPAILVLFIFGLFAWQAAGRRLAIGTVISLICVGLIGAWEAAMVTLALVLTSVLFCMVIGLPTGIWLARSDRALAVVRPILDAMQTTPAFVYLVPIVMVFGIGNVPGVVVTIVFALPPLIRLTNLGIRQVPGDLVEAAQSFGASKRQLLLKVQLPLAMPTIMAGVNQTLMLALSMVVIASMIGVGGLGQMVLRGIGRLDMGLATVGGVGIVIMAIVLDRMTQAMGQEKTTTTMWYETGPVGLVRQALRAGRQA